MFIPPSPKNEFSKWFMQAKVAGICHHAAGDWSALTLVCPVLLLSFPILCSIYLSIISLPTSQHLRVLWPHFFLAPSFHHLLNNRPASISPLTMSCCSCVQTACSLFDIYRDLSWQSLPKYQANADERDIEKETSLYTNTGSWNADHPIRDSGRELTFIIKLLTSTNNYISYEEVHKPANTQENMLLARSRDLAMCLKKSWIKQNFLCFLSSIKPKTHNQ